MGYAEREMVKPLAGFEAFYEAEPIQEKYQRPFQLPENS
jgi:hypothetical protein